MPTSSRSLQRLINCQNGATAIEYALIASAVALAIVSPLVFLGDQLGGTYDTIGSLMASM